MPRGIGSKCSTPCHEVPSAVARLTLLWPLDAVTVSPPNQAAGDVVAMTVTSAPVSASGTETGGLCCTGAVTVTVGTPATHWAGLDVMTRPVVVVDACAVPTWTPA